MEVVSPDRYASLKAHKALPRRRAVSDKTRRDQPSKSSKRATSDTQAKKDDEISSWIQNASGVASNPNIQLPLTPPSLPQDSTQKSTSVEPSSIDNSNTIESRRPPELTTTPVNHRSPPTPDLTPPRPVRKNLVIPTSPYLNPPLSRTESFKTANEQASSDDGPNQLTSLLPIEAMAPPSIARPKDIGLGLGLESDDGSQTPTTNTPRVRPDPVTIVEPWNAGLNVVDDDLFSVQEPAAVQEFKISKRSSIAYADVPTGLWDGNAQEDFQASLDRGLSLRKRVQKNKQNPTDKSTELFGEQIQWPAEKSNGPGHGARTPEMDTKRLSQMSATSTVVEALVVDSPQRKRGKLRHSSKVNSLRAASSPVSGSNRSSMASSEAKPRLMHKKGKIADYSNRISMNSDSGISMGFDQPPKGDDNISLSEVPQRRSSLKAASRRESGHSRKRSGASRPGAVPPGKSIEDAKDRARYKPRAASESSMSRAPLEERGRKSREFQPIIPPRAASLSAPTSRNGSRTASLTSASLHKHNTQQTQQASTSGQTRQLLQPPTTPNHPLVKQSSDDLSPLRPVSLHTRTPFSAISMSSTPGPYEVNEATAISIYPHNNKSLLVVQQRARRDSTAPEVSASLTENVRITLKDQATNSAEAQTNCLDHSPLKNPRPAPKTPAVMLIPPTPASRTPSVEQSQSSRGRRDAASASKPLSMVRRALSARRYSESLVASFARSFSRRENTGFRQRDLSKGGEPKLSPFWRPRGFWADVSDSDSEPNDEGSYVRNTLGLSQKKLIPGPISLVRRLGSIKRYRILKAGASCDPSARQGFGPRFGNFSEAHYRDVERRVGAVHRLRHHAPLRPFTGFYEALERFREKRTEERLERQRERLKRNIGPVILKPEASASLN